MNFNKRYSQLLSSIRPGYIIAITIVIAVVMVSSAVFELTQSKSELKHLMTEEATSLIETISMSSANTVLSNDEIEDLIAQRLLTTGRMLAHLDSIKALTSSQLVVYAEESSVYRINVFDRNGEKTAGSLTPDSSHMMMQSKYSPKDFIKPILRGEKSEIIIGLKEARHEEGSRFAVAVKRANNRGGAIVVNVDAAYMLAFRKKIGFGKMIQDIGHNSGIEYILLQDYQGIISASKQVKDMSSISQEEFLKNAYDKDSVFTRIAEFGGRDVFEVVKTFRVNDEKLGLFRLGLSMDEMHALESRMLRRGVTISVILFVIAVIGIIAISVNQNLKFVSHEYKRIQTYTGNILQNLADSVITTDKKGTIMIFNESAEKVFGIKEEQAKGRFLFDLLKEPFKAVEDSFLSKNPVEIPVVDFSVIGEESRTFSVSTTFIYESTGEVDAFTVVLRDITQLKKMEEQVKQREKMTAMGELASGVAHEIRNPLNAISMIAQRYKKEFAPKKNSEDYNSLTNVLLKETKRVNKIIQQFLEFARPPRLNLTEVSSKDFLKELKTLFGTACSSKGIKFEVMSSNDTILRLDPELLKQAIINILQNSLEVTGKGGAIKLEFYFDKKRFLFIITDTGAGISEENKNRIFNLYFTTKPRGTGLGLSIVQQIVSQHKGTIKVESEPGKGTKFTIEIPIDQA
jgi:two-component system sensor histidine kinase HydH